MKMKKSVFYNGVFHSMLSEADSFYAMEVTDGRISRVYPSKDSFPDSEKTNGTDLCGRHVYPCLIDGHTHMLLTVSVMAMGFSACQITPEGIFPNTVDGVGKRVREYAEKQKKNAIIAINNYILTAIDERRMPTKDELDAWGGGRAVVIYNIDGHSTSLSSKMLSMIGISPEGHDGILQGEANERAQGRIIDAVGATLGLSDIAKGVGRFHNYCAEYGINIVGALEGNGDSKNDITTKLIIHLARHFDMKVRLYLQYTDFDRIKPYAKMMKHPRVGGCGDWEMDGASGSHSAAFYTPYTDTGMTAPCYYEQDFVDKITAQFDAEGYQIASHAIGEAGIDRILCAFDKLPEKNELPYHRIEHCEFHSDEALEKLKRGRYAVMMQPGYAWIDKRYLHSYEQVLPEEIRSRIKLKSLFDAGVCVCGSSDSPVQDMDPYLQMLGMVQFYNENESVSPYTAFCSYTKNAAAALLESDDFGTLECGKIADFFTADCDFFSLPPEKVVAFRPVQTYYGGKAYKNKKGSVAELIKMLLTKPKLI